MSPTRPLLSPQRPPTPRWLLQGSLAYGLDFAFYGLACVALGAALWWQGGTAWSWAWVAVGWGLWTLLEYGLHRWVLHGAAPFQAWHATHHRQPTARVGAPTWLSGGLFLFGLALPSAWLLDVGSALAFMLGLMLGYLAYTALHHRLHHPPLQPSRWLAQRLRWHRRHHASAAGGRRQAGHFGVSTGLWDVLLSSGGRRVRRR
jgi:sterol desaturase/sphingolipid hydroxylase (fatty acid hydroxylase superfamily)